jgi:hypothetical protein
LWWWLRRTVLPAVWVGVEWTAGVKADAVELRAVYNILGWCATIAKVLHQSTGNDGNVRAGNSERGGSSANLGDEVSDFVGVEHHEFVHSGHAWVTHVRRETHLADTTAAKQNAEVLIQMSEEATRKLSVGC